jgi:hypothetical protein
MLNLITTGISNIIINILPLHAPFPILVNTRNINENAEGMKNIYSIKIEAML